MPNFDQSDAPARSPAIPGAGATLPEPLPPEPMPIVRAWFDEARARRVQPNPDAMTLATVDAAGAVSARIVLCKAIDERAGFVVFYTNYRGRKSRALEDTGRAAAVFHWDLLDRQARLEGSVEHSPEAESDAYFASRPWQSRIGAWASEQSEPVESRAAMLARVEAAMRRFGLDPANPPADGAAVEIPRPAHWGGWRLWAERVELWVAGVGRVHDRAVWTRGRVSGSAAVSHTNWAASRLQP